jgi:hypothetical protein
MKLPLMKLGLKLRFLTLSRLQQDADNRLKEAAALHVWC